MMCRPCCKDRAARIVTTRRAVVAMEDANIAIARFRLLYGLNQMYILSDSSSAFGF